MPKPFSKLRKGATFSYDSAYYIKTDDVISIINNKTFNAINLLTGNLEYFDENIVVKKIELYISEKSFYY